MKNFLSVLLLACAGFLSLPAYAQPANDNCSNAQNLGTLPTPAACPSGAGNAVNVTGTNINATAPNPYTYLQGCSTGGNQPAPALDVWYSFVASGTIVNINMTGGSPALPSPAITLWQGNNCNNLTGVGCDNNGTAAGANSATFSPLTPGQTYYIQISGMNSTAAGNFNMSVSNSNDCNDCLLGASLTASPLPTNGTYLPGTQVTFCLTITNWNQVNANWLHGIIPTFGNGWNLSTLQSSGTPPPASGGYAWFFANGPLGTGWWVDLDPVGPGTFDGNFANNFGYSPINGTGSWTFCWRITTASSCGGGTNLNMSVNTTADGETGNWTSPACQGDPVINFSAILACCSSTATATNPTCFGGTNGSILVTAASGNPGFNVSWTGPSSGNPGGTEITAVNGTYNITGLSAGTYTVTVTDNNNCTSVQTVTLTQPTALANTQSQVNVLCNGGNNGSLALNVTGGTPGYNISWTGAATGNPAGTEIAASGGSYTMTNLVAGSYTVTITDANGCTRTTTATITQPTAITATPTPTHVLCVGQNNGSISMNVSGGTPGYNVSWTGPSTGNPAGTEIAASGGTYVIPSLVAGTYTVTVTDLNGCTRTNSVVINPGVTIDANITPVAAQCLNGNLFNLSGTTSTISSGTITSYTWNWGDATPNSTGSTASHTYAAAGTYTVTLTVSNGSCTNTETLSVTVNPNPTVALNVVPPLCFGQNGTITANPSNGSSFSYAWNPPAAQTTQSVSVPAGGPYAVTVTNNFGCTATASASMTQPTQLTATMGAPTMVSCNGGNNGAVAVTAAGGTGALTYSWSPAPGAGQGTASVSSLTAGTYTVTVTDANGCTRTASATITQPAALAHTQSQVNVLCNGANTGSVNLNVTGGTPGYNVSWTGTSSGNPAGTEIAASGGSYTITPLTAGTYNVTVTDANGCTRTTSATITQPALLTATMGAPTMVSCFGGNNGSVSVTAAGGTSPYTYNWSPAPGAGQGTAAVSSLTAGAYTVTVTDNAGCTATASVTITQPTLLTSSISGTNVSCFGGNNGSATVTINGGPGGNTIVWSPAPGGGQGTATATGLTAQTYTVTVTSTGGCTTTSTFTPTQPTAIVLTPSSTNTNCGASTGTVSVAAAGGAGGYSYSWNTAPVQTTSTATGLIAGNYTVTVTDVNGCTSTASAVVNNNAAPSISEVLASHVDVSCFGGNNGAAQVSVAGGTPPLTINWSPAPGSGQGTANAGGLTAGTYTVTVTDDNSCSSSINIVITQPTQLTATMGAPVMVTCFGGNNGSASVTAGGGTAPYTYNWSPAPGAGQGTSSVSSLVAGNYTVTITDNLNCTATASVTITQPTELTSSVTGTNVSCFGGTNGTATATINGGPGGNTIVWSPAPGGGQGTSSVTGLSNGTYTVTVTSTGGCTTTSSVVITQPTAVTVSGTFTPAHCGQADGTATANGAGGTGVISYSWNTIPVQSTATANGLPAGSYTVTATDANGCTATTSVTINDVAGPTATAVVNSNATGFGLCNGSATVTPSGGSAPYTFLWDNGTATATANNLCAGNPCVTVTDAFGCETIVCVTITQPDPLVVTLSPTNLNCFNICTGQISSLVTGGVSPYTYAWSNGATSTGVTGLCAGNYSVTVTDNNGNTATASVTITQPLQIQITSATATPASCNGVCDGTVSSSATGGTGTLSFSWTGGLSGANHGSLCDGAYTVTVTDANACTATASVTITEPPLLQVSTTVVNANCGNPDGSAQTSVIGGTAPYSYAWSNGATSADINNVLAASYTVTVTDFNGCTATATAVVGNNQAGTLNIALVNNVFCAGGANGSATGNVTGGAAPFTYSWNTTPVQTTATATGLSAGTWTLTVTDDNNCVLTSTITITEPAPLTATTASTPVTCHGGSDGAVGVSGGGGSPAYVITWTNSSNVQVGTTAGVTGLPADTYTVSILDDNGCTISQSVTVTQPPLYTLAVVAQDATCKDECNGNASAQVNGGTTPYTYAWSDNFNQTTATAVFLCANTYTVTVTDANGCTLSSPVTVGEPPLMVLSSTAVDANCQQNDGSGCVDVVGGTAPYSYNWLSIANTANCGNNLFSGTYLVEVTDGNLCKDTVAVQVNDIAGPTAVIASSTNVSCFGLSDGSATVNMVGGTGIFTVQWDANAGNQTTPTASNLPAGTYAVSIVDAVGCGASTNVTITQPTQVIHISTETDPSCFAFCDGSISIAVSGGVTPYTYDWRDGSNASIGTGTNSVTGLCDGSYTLILSDANGCTQILPYTLTQPVQVTGTVSSTNNTCFQSCNGTATITPISGFAPFSFSWSSAPVQTTGTATNLCAGTYDVVLTDATGCSNTYSATITEPTLLTAAIVNSGNVSCAGVCDGFAEGLAAGGTAPYLYSWSNGTTTQLNNGLCVGTYTFTVTDANGCTASATVDIIEPSALTVTASGTNISCFQACDGTLNATASGGTAPYSFQWDNATFATTAAVNNVCAGSYTVVLTDANGCSVTSSTTLTQPAILDFVANSTNSNCGQNNGQICTSVIGGVAPYSYQWNDPAAQTTACVFNITAGCYTLTITDGNGCVKDSLLCINDIVGPSFTIDAFADVTCNGANDGSITITASGVTLPLTITWQDGTGTTIPSLTNNSSPNGLDGDTYGIVVTDAAGCVAAGTQLIFEPTALFAAVTSTTQPLCFGACDGTATVSVSGATTPYTYNWSSGAAIASAANTGLCAGTHSVQVTDANGCVFTANTTIGEPTALLVNTTLVQNITCNALCNGAITVAASGATAPYFYSWTNNVSNGSNANTLCAGAYSTTVTDNNGCSVTVNNTLTEPDALTLTITSENATCSQCNGTADAVVTGGVLPYSYSWTSGAALTSANNSGLCAGTASLNVTDANGCTIAGTANLIDEAGPTIGSLTSTGVSCFGGSNGTATVVPVGGTAPLTFQWDDPSSQTSSSATGLIAGTYCVVVADANNCQVTNCTTVTQPSTLGAVGDLDVTICFGDSTQLWASGAGGTAPYTINWQTAGLSGPGPIMVTPLATTTYCFTVTDANGCISPQDCITITVNPPLSVDMSPATSICSGTSTQIQAQGSGGNGGPYTYTWTDQNGNAIASTTSGNSSFVTVSPTVPTWYYVELSDDCSLPVVDSVLISIDANPIVFFNAVDSSGCAPFTAQFILNTDIGVNYSYDFNCDGVIDYTGTSTTPVFTYPNAGTYTVCASVTSAQGCVTNVTFTDLIDVYPVPVAGFVSDPTVTTILNPGFGFTNTTTGTPVLYQWDFGDGNTVSGAPGAVIPANTNGGATSGTYDNPQHVYADTGSYDVTLLVTNQFGCTDEVTYTVIVQGDFAIYVPNAFTPNGDGKNDIFIPQGIMFGGDGYEFLIFNRWGELIFESYNSEKGWDGTHKGIMCKNDVYVWKVKAVDHNQIPHEFIGHVTLVR